MAIKPVIQVIHAWLQVYHEIKSSKSLWLH